MLEKLPLIESRKEIFLFLLIIFILFSINLSFEYRNYKKIVEEGFYRDDFIVLNQYRKKTKRNKTYFILKLSNGDFTFYTNSYLKLPNILNKRVNLVLNTEKISFLDYLKGFYSYSFDLNILDTKPTFKDFLIDYIKSSHKNREMREFFLAIFLAVPPSKELREKINILGVSHLIAISGFHLGILTLILFFLLKYPYYFLQNRYFPYRNREVDLTIITSSILLLYIGLTNSPPSLIRSFVMMIIGFYLYYRNYQLLSFKTLLIALLIIISLFPKLLFSLSLWFSVAGVFYIYLFLHYFKKLNKITIFILLNFWVFLLMFPISHSIFPQFSYYQFLSPILSMLFTIFYPLEIFLHFIGFGNLLDGAILKLLSLNGEIIMVETPLYFFIGYIILSLLSIFHRFFLFLLLITDIIFFFTFLS